jgi:hypothetical protein
MGPDPPNKDATHKEEPVNAFEAYRSEVVVEQFPRKIQSLCIWGDQVLAGLQDGSLLFFRNVSGDTGGGKGAWQVCRFDQTHARAFTNAVAQAVSASTQQPATVAGLCRLHTSKCWCGSRHMHR